MQEFWTDDTNKVAVPLMSQSGVFQYFSDGNRNCFVIKLPFSKKAYMLLVRSIKGTDLNHIEALLTSNVISEWQHKLKKRFVHLSLPKFSMGTVSDLKEILTNIKLPDLLGKSSDFTKLSNKEHLTIDKVLNKVIFEVTEEGSENHTESRDSIPTPLELKINKPFFFAVVEGNSDALLLLGRITNPSSN
ncbi:angiotensinogen isoform X2 [Polyodon spathula]|nr:angiotensinogen isoform X2 [Polyodon spathula]